MAEESSKLVVIEEPGEMPVNPERVRAVIAKTEVYVQIRDDADMEKAGEVVKKALTPLIREIDDSFEEVLKEQREAKAAQDRAIKTTLKQKERLREPLYTLRQRIKAAITVYIERRDRVRERLARQSPMIAAAPVAEPPKVNIRKTYDVQILSLDKVPRQYLKADLPRMKALAKSMNGGPDAVAALGGPKAVRIVEKIS